MTYSSMRHSSKYGDEHRIAFERLAAGEGTSQYKGKGLHRDFYIPSESVRAWDLTKDDALEYRNCVRRVLRKFHEAAEKEQRVLTDVEQKAWDFAAALADDLTDSIEARPEELRVAHLFCGTAAPSGRAMRDREGREHRVYAPREQISTTQGNYGDGSSLGSIIRALACGPRSDADERALAGGVNSAGGFTVPRLTSELFIDKMRAASSCIQAGAQTVMLETEQTTFARLKGDPGIAWKPENAQFSPSDPVFDAVVFNARTLFTIVPMSIELLQDTLNADAAIERAISQKFAEELDRVALVGSGSASEPTGIKNQAGIGTYMMAADGLALADYDPVLMAILQLQNANAKPPTAAIMAPRTFQQFGVLKDSQGRYLEKPATIRDLPFLVTSQLPVNETQGTSDAASSIFVGDFADLWIGMRMGLTVKILTERYSDYGQVAIMAMMRCDTQLAQPASFCRIAGVL